MMNCDCSVLNRHMHPEPTDNCRDCCCMCCGYCLPAGVAVLVVVLMLAATVFYILLMKDYPDAWRIVVCILFILITLFVGCAVLWSYYQVIYTRPGYVDRNPWKHRPVYVPLETGLEGLAGRDSANATPQPQQQQQQRLASVVTTVPHNAVLDNADEATYPREELSAREGGSCSNPLLKDIPQYSSPSSEVQVPVLDGAVPSSSQPQGPAGGPGVAVLPEAGAPRRRTHSPYEPSAAQAGGAAGANPERAAAASQQAAQRSDEGNGANITQSAQQAKNPYIVSQLDRFGNLRYCKFCQLYKPDRAYHCYSCRRCVYNFDHHCPFINNCVGRNNYRLFVLFLLYAAVACFIACVPMVIAIFAMSKQDIMDKIGWVAVPGIMLILALTLGIFYVDHRCLMTKGESTVESVVRERMREQRMRERGINPWSAKRREYDARQLKNSRATLEPLTEEEKRFVAAKKKERIDEHKRELWGTETGWRAYLPYPFRVDDTADGVRHV